MPEFGSTEAFLCLEVVSLETREPLEGVSLALRTEGVDRARLRPRLDWQGVLGDGLVTSPEGRAEYVVGPGTGYVLDVNWRKDPTLPSRHENVPPLRPGERREVTIGLRQSLDRMWRARVISGDDRRPVPSAEVSLMRGTIGNGQAVTTQLSSSDGSVAIRYAAWQGNHVRVSAPGHSALFFALAEQSPDSPAAELVLWETAELVVEVRDSSGASLSAIELSVTLGPSPEAAGIPEQLSFRAQTLGDGRCHLEGLPSRRSLSLSRSHDGSSARRFRGELILEPGESRTLTWQLDPACAIEGKVVDQAFVPVAGREIWLVSADSHNGYLTAWMSAGLRLTTTTDSAGHYSFPEVDPGWWRVGPAPAVRSKARQGVLPPAAYAPVAHAFYVDRGAVRTKIDLVAWEGVTLRGCVLGENGEPAAGAMVTARGLDHDLHTRSADDGSFELGPLEPVEYTVGAFLLEGSSCPSETRAVQGGESGIELRLGKGAALRGRVLDELGLPVERAELLCSSREGFSTLEVVESGAFEMQSLPAGTFTLLARLPHDRVASLGDVRLVPGESRSDLELTAVHGAALRVSARGFEDGEGLEYLASVGPHGPIRGMLRPSSETRVQLPSGVVKLEISRRHPDGGRAILLEDSVFLAPGEERALDLDARSLSRIESR